jgi:hypothetical protein
MLGVKMHFCVLKEENYMQSGIMKLETLEASWSHSVRPELPILQIPVMGGGLSD